MKKLLLIIFAVGTFAMSTNAQSVMITSSLTKTPSSSALVQYNNLFGQWNMPDKDDPFPFAVIRVDLAGNANSVLAAKQKLGFDVGSLQRIESDVRTEPNMIIILVPKEVRNISLTCGDGCEKRVLYSGRLASNAVYTCKVEYTPAENENQEGLENTSENTSMQVLQEIQSLKEQLAQIQGQTPIQSQSSQDQGGQIAPRQTVVYQQQPKQQSNQLEQAQTTNGKKLQFNPQPSDNYIIGLTVGYTGRQAKATYDGETEKGGIILGKKNAMASGFMFGLTINPTFKYGIGLRTGLFMDYSRETLKEGGEKYWSNDITLSMPLQISYRYELIKKLSFMIYTGPVFDFGAFCNTNIYDEKKNLYSPDAWEDFSGKRKYIGFNCSWGIGAGIQWDWLRLDIGGEFGMVNKYKDMYDESDMTINWNKPIYVSLTCFF